MLFTARRLIVTASSLLLAAAGVLGLFRSGRAAETFAGKFYRGTGDVEYLQLLDIARRMFEPDPELQSLPMLYAPAWNGFVEGPTWGAWWIQNSYGPTYCALPFYQEPLFSFLQNAQDLWFDQIGDGKRVSAHNWVAPDGCLCDAASPGWVYPKQGDGRIDIHDWGMEFTAAGLLMQAELLLIQRDRAAIARYLSRLERSAEFIESRRDPQKNLFLAGPAGNLLAPSYAGYRRPDGKFDKAYLAGLGITYIAALDRLIELEQLAGQTDKAKRYGELRESARRGLPAVTTADGYFLKSLDPDGTQHGVYGAAKHGYFEAVCNHDAVCFRVVDDPQAERIVAKMCSIQGLRPHDLIITNYPRLDDMYVPGTDWLWGFGTWVNGGHWTTCEARMVMAYYRTGRYEDARRSMRQIMKFARAFRMDNPLVDFGNAVYQPREPINLCYDTFGGPAAMLRGLFEYLYRADGLTLLPHIPPGITRLEQDFPVRFGAKRLYLATTGTGPISAVLVNGQPWSRFDAKTVTLPYDQTPEQAVIQLVLGNATPAPFTPRTGPVALPPEPPAEDPAWGPKLFPVISVNRLPLRIGADSNGENRFVGDIARAQVFSRALTPAEVKELAAGRDATRRGDPSLIGDWRLDQRRNNAFANLAVDGLVAKVVGEVKTVEGPESATEFSGKGYLEVADDPRLQLNKGCTMAAWLRSRVQAAGGGRIIDKCRVGTANGYMIDTFPGGSLRLIVERGTPSYDAKLRPDRWTHVAATVDGDGTLALYLDGQRVTSQKTAVAPEIGTLRERAARLGKLHGQLAAAGLGDCYEAAHARLVVEYHAVTHQRLRLLAEGKLQPLPADSQYAADRSYFAATMRLCEGLEKVLNSYATSSDSHKKRVFALWSVK
jgi:hypothetical protein